MASTVLPNGIIIPEKYSRDWYADLYHNWQELDNLLGGGTPKDGTLTIQKNGTTVGTFSANQATNETIDITVPAVNDGTLTIQRNGTTVDTFTANSSTDKTVDITVPTKTSDLTNDSGFITSDNTKIPLAGSNAISGSLIPATTDAYDLGGTSYQWNNAYIKSLTINGVACGDILTHNAGEFVDVTSAQTVAGNKEFTGTTKAHDVVPSATNSYNFGSPTARWNNAYATAFNGDVVGIGTLVLKSNSSTARILLRNNDVSSFPNSVNLYSKVDNVEYGVFLNGSTFFPTIDGEMNFGYSQRRWKDCSTKAINGLNPGALSLPSSTYINVDTTNWDLTCQNELMGSFTPTADGWLMLHVANSGTSEVNFWVIGGVIRINNKSSISTTDNNNFNMITIPVEKDVTYNIYGNASEYVAGRSIAYCRFMPCRGNV